MTDAAPEATVPLDEFCADLSRTVRSVEAIAAWRSRELLAGRNHDTPSAYLERFKKDAAIRAP